MSENVNPEATIPEEGQSADVGGNADDNAAVNNDGASATDEQQGTTPSGTSQNSESNEPEFSLEIKYDKENRSLSRNEAITFAQKGLFYENSVEPLYKKLDYVAAQQGRSIEEVVDSIFKADEDTKRAELEQKFGEDNPELIEQLMTLHRNEQQAKYDGILADRKKAAETTAENERKTLESRLADEFSELKKEFPEMESFALLPESVKKEAASGKNLLSAYLLHKHREEKRADDAARAAAEAAKASTGSSGSTDPTPDSATDAMLRGIWGK